eukprot:6721022-Prymnesium_polylepis.1
MLGELLLTAPASQAAIELGARAPRGRRRRPPLGRYRRVHACVELARGRVRLGQQRAELHKLARHKARPDAARAVAGDKLPVELLVARLLVLLVVGLSHPDPPRPKAATGGRAATIGESLEHAQQQAVGLPCAVQQVEVLAAVQPLVAQCEQLGVLLSACDGSGRRGRIVRLSDSDGSGRGTRVQPLERRLGGGLPLREDLDGCDRALLGAAQRSHVLVEAVANRERFGAA